MTQFDEHEPLLTESPELPAGAFGAMDASPALREAVWQGTVRRLRWRRRTRRAAIACAFVLVYAAGFGTTQFLPEEPSDVVRVATHEPAPPTEEAPPVVEAPAPAAEPITAKLLLDPEALARRLYAAGPEERRQLLKQAGDCYLADRGDIKEAVQCYRRLLDLAPADEPMTVEKDDNWLLVSLKEARQKERGDASA